MILTKDINLTINPNNIKHLNNIGYSGLTMFEKINIPLEHLSSGSSYRINAVCDVCEKEISVTYRHYNVSISKGGYYCCSNKCNFDKKRDNFLSDDNRNKIKQTCLEKYGVENPFESNEVRNKIKETLIRKYGVENPMFNHDIKYRLKKSILDKYGVDNISKSPIIKNKKEMTSMGNYGVKYHLQNSTSFNNCFKSSSKLKKYKETDIYYQGSYEYDFIEYCDKNHILGEIQSYRKGIKYIMNNKNKIYYPDFYMQKLNLIIEIKSTYTYNYHLEMNKLKENACKILGYNYLIIIDKNYNRFEELINHTSIPM